MLQLIFENKFEELKVLLRASSDFEIHKLLFQILDEKKEEVPTEGFHPNNYENEFLEGFGLYEALEKSTINPLFLDRFQDVLINLSYKMGTLIQTLANAAMEKGVYFSEVESVYKINDKTRERVQDFIELLKRGNNNEVAIATLALTKFLVSGAITNLLEKWEVGKDTLQFAQAYEDIGETDMAKVQFYSLTVEFESESFRLSSGLFPEIRHVDTRPEEELLIYEQAKNNYERLSGETLKEPRRVHVNESREAADFVNRFRDRTQTYPESEKESFWSRLRRKFRGKN